MSSNMDNRKKLAENYDIPQEEASRIIIEKEKTLAQSEIKYHIKAMCDLLDKIKTADPSFGNNVSKETIKFILARQGNLEMFDEILEYIENLQDNFFEKVVFDE